MSMQPQAHSSRPCKQSVIQISNNAQTIKFNEIHNPIWNLCVRWLSEVLLLWVLFTSFCLPSTRVVCLCFRFYCVFLLFILSFRSLFVGCWGDAEAAHFWMANKQAIEHSSFKRVLFVHPLISYEIADFCWCAKFNRLHCVAKANERREFG